MKVDGDGVGDQVHGSKAALSENVQDLKFCKNNHWHENAAKRQVAKDYRNLDCSLGE